MVLSVVQKVAIIKAKWTRHNAAKFKSHSTFENWTTNKNNDFVDALMNKPILSSVWSLRISMTAGYHMGKVMAGWNRLKTENYLSCV